MSGTRYVCGYDFGTLSCRIVVRELETGECVFEDSVDYSHGVMTERLPGGVALERNWALQAPEDYLEAMACLTHSAIQHIPPHAIAALGTDFTNCTVVPIGADGQPLSIQPAYRPHPHAWVKLWKHHAAQPQAERIEKALLDQSVPWFGLYGRNVSSEWLFPKLLQIYEEDPEIYQAAEHFMEAADYITYWLTGKVVRNDATLGVNAFHDNVRGYPGAELLETFAPGFGSVLDKLRGEVAEVGSRAGTLRGEAARRLGLPQGVVVSVGHGDSEIVAAGLGITASGTMQMVMGTSTCYQMLHKNKTAFNGVAAIVYGGMLPELFAYESGQPAVGDTFSWFARNMLPQAYHDAAGQRGKHILQYMDELCQFIPAGASGLLALDWFNGNRSVLMNYNLRGCILGLTLSTRPEEIYRCLIESTALGARRIFEGYNDAGVGIERVYAVGGLARKSPLTMQIYADILGYPITVPSTENASATGACVCAAVALEYGAGTLAAFTEVCKRMIHYQTAVYAPNPRAAKVYERLYDAYRELHDFMGLTSTVYDVLEQLHRT